MREIKFKFLFGYMIDNPFFIKDGKKYLEKVTLNLEQLMECEYEYSIPSYFTLIAKLQYTGLKDKNGVEIYEGDILKISNISVLRCEFKNGCFVLIHSKEFAGVDNLLWGNLGRLYDTNMNDIFELTEVIGNIYENTELLETT